MSTPESDTLTLQEYLDGIETLQKTEGWRIHEEIQRLGRKLLHLSSKL
jgi:hypothetical protein